jgi:hypothetical protein
MKGNQLFWLLHFIKKTFCIGIFHVIFAIRHTFCIATAYSII